MKKTTVIIFLLIYSLTTVGAVVNLHYCMGRYTGWSLSYERANKCQTCGMAKARSKGCCKDEFKQVKANKEHLQQQISFYAGNSLYQPAILPRLTEHRIRYSALNNIYPIVHAPPRPSAISAQILHCVFLI